MLFFLSACQPDSSLSGDVLLWYGADETTTTVLESMLAEFEASEPMIKVIAVPILADELAERFVVAAQQGLGPDILLGSAENIHTWANANLIQPLDADVLQDNKFLQAVQATQFKQQNYGVPLAVHPPILYYNKDRVKIPATTLDDWLAQATEGNRILIHNRFQTLFWGVSTMGSDFMNTNGQIVLEADALLTWLNWLKTAQNDGELIITRDGSLLQQSFLSGQAGYIIEDTAFLNTATTVLSDTLGIATLPKASFTSGSLIDVEAFMLNKHAAPTQVEIAKELILFLTNPEQSAVWLRETRRVPANRNTSVDQQLYPMLAAVAREARFGIYHTADIDIVRLREAGNVMFGDVLTGVVEPDEAVCQFGRYLQDNYPDMFDPIQWESVCDLGGGS